MSTTKIFDPKITCGSGGGGSGGSETFTGLTDTPEDYVAHAGELVTVNVAETGLTFVDPSTVGGRTNVYAVIAGDNYQVMSTQQLVSAEDFYLAGDLTLTGDWAFVNTNNPVTSNRTNIYALQSNEEYQVKRDQQLVSAADFYLYGDLTLSGDWAYVVDRNPASMEYTLASTFSGRDHNVIWSYDSKRQMYFYILHHGLDRHPSHKMLSLAGQELEPEVIHLSRKKLMIRSNVPIGSTLTVI